MQRKHRGLTFVTVLLFAAVIAGVVWGITYGEAYWENLEVKRVLKEAANLSYQLLGGWTLAHSLKFSMHRLASLASSAH